jgi:hypothetical protein
MRSGGGRVFRHPETRNTHGRRYRAAARAAFEERLSEPKLCDLFLCGTKIAD